MVSFTIYVTAAPIRFNDRYRAARMNGTPRYTTVVTSSRVSSVAAEDMTHVQYKKWIQIPQLAASTTLEYKCIPAACLQQTQCHALV